MGVAALAPGLLGAGPSHQAGCARSQVMEAHAAPQARRTQPPPAAGQGETHAGRTRGGASLGLDERPRKVPRLGAPPRRVRSCPDLLACAPSGGISPAGLEAARQAVDGPGLRGVPTKSFPQIPTPPPRTGGGLTPAERTAFERDGFVILRGVIPPAECERFLWAAVEPALARAGIKHDDRTTWTPGDGTTVQARHPTAPPARPSSAPSARQPHRLCDQLLAAAQAADGGDHPIPLSDPDSRWPALFGSARLNAAIDELHGGAAA